MLESAAGLRKDAGGLVQWRRRLLLDGVGNYGFMVSTAKALSQTPSGQVLDFGCGRGQLVALGLQNGLDIVGADTFAGAYKQWSATVDPDVRARVSRIVGGVLPFEDCTFDVVVANMVFEHVAEPLPAFKEINRVLKSGGHFLACFPTRDVWFEGHVGVYFAHWLRNAPALQYQYLRTLRRLGFGYYGQNKSPERWASSMQGVMRDAVCYHKFDDIKGWWFEAFGSEPESVATDYIVFRAGQHPRLAGLARYLRWRALRPLVTFVCHRRAGRVLLTTKVS